MKAIFERFDGSRTIQSPSSLNEQMNVMLIPRRSLMSGETIDYMRFNKTNQIIDNLPLFVQSDEDVCITLDGPESISNLMPVPIMKRDSVPAAFTKNSN